MNKLIETIVFKLNYYGGYIISAILVVGVIYLNVTVGC